MMAVFLRARADGDYHHGAAGDARGGLRPGQVFQPGAVHK
jgi:hypothetical protein